MKKLTSGLLGAVLILLALIAASGKTGALGLGAFLCFFTVGVTVLMEGFRKKNNTPL